MSPNHDLTGPKIIPIYGAHVYVICSHFVATNISIHGSNRSFIQRQPLWVVSGRSKTNNAGEVTLHINDYLTDNLYPICDVSDIPPFDDLAIIGSEPEFIATPESDTPVVLTSALEASPRVYEGPPYWFRDVLNGNRLTSVTSYDINVKIKAWDLDGNPAPRKTFSWICVAEAALREIEV